MKKTVRFISALSVISIFITSCSQGGSDKTNPSASAKNTSSLNDSTNSERSESVNGNWLLVPGVSAGQIKIDEDVEDVIKRLGKADSGDAAMGKAVSIWYNNHDSTSHSVAVYSSRNMGNEEISRIKQVRINSPSFKTKEGIHPGSSLADIKNKFSVKRTEAYKDAGVNYTVYGSNSGIAFEISPDSTCAAIVIQEADATGLGSYLKLRASNQVLKHQ